MPGRSVNKKRLSDHRRALTLKLAQFYKRDQSRAAAMRLVCADLTAPGIRWATRSQRSAGTADGCHQ